MMAEIAESSSSGDNNVNEETSESTDPLDELSILKNAQAELRSAQEEDVIRKTQAKQERLRFLKAKPKTVKGMKRTAKSVTAIRTGNGMISKEAATALGNLQRSRNKAYKKKTTQMGVDHNASILVFQAFPNGTQWSSHVFGYGDFAYDFINSGLGKLVENTWRLRVKKMQWRRVVAYKERCASKNDAPSSSAGSNAGSGSIKEGEAIGLFEQEDEEGMWTDEEDLGESNMSVDITESEIGHHQSGLSPLPEGSDFTNIVKQTVVQHQAQTGIVHRTLGDLSQKRLPSQQVGIHQEKLRSNTPTAKEAVGGADNIQARAKSPRYCAPTINNSPGIRKQKQAGLARPNRGAGNQRILPGLFQPQLPNQLVDASQAIDKISTPASTVSVSNMEEPAHPGFVGSPEAPAASTSTPPGHLQAELNVSTEEASQQMLVNKPVRIIRLTSPQTLPSPCMTCSVQPHPVGLIRAQGVNVLRLANGQMGVRLPDGKVATVLKLPNGFRLPTASALPGGPPPSNSRQI